MSNLQEENVINTYLVSLVANPFPTNNSTEYSPIKRKNKCFNALSTKQTGDERTLVTVSDNENSSPDNQHMRFEFRGPDRVQWTNVDEIYETMRCDVSTNTIDELNCRHLPEQSAHVDKLIKFLVAFSQKFHAIISILM